MHLILILHDGLLSITHAGKKVALERSQKAAEGTWSVGLVLLFICSVGGETRSWPQLRDMSGQASLGQLAGYTFAPNFS